jgi:hypothetical protein
MKRSIAAFLFGISIVILLVISAPLADAQSNTLTFTTIGDYGVNNEDAAAVASMINQWNTDIIVTLGDDYYASAGGTGTETYDLSTGQYYCNFLKDITTTGTACPMGEASINRFFPALGNHDYDDAGIINNLPVTYTEYFHLPGDGYTSSSDNERYYDFVAGPAHFFILNAISDPGYEPDGTDSSSTQAQWLQAQLAASTSTWNVVVSHEAPYSSGTQHGPAEHMQWPFAQWGADVVFSGHEHNYERIHKDGIVYFVNGLGGAWIYPFGAPIEGSAARYNGSHGAQRVSVTDQSMTVEFYSIEDGGTLQDTYTITTPHKTPTPTAPLIETGWHSPAWQAAAGSFGDRNGYEVDPAHAFANDNLAATDIDSGTSYSTSCYDSGKDKHRFSNYNLSLPGGSLIQGIRVRADAYADSAVGAPRLCVSLSWDGGATWSPWRISTELTNLEETYILGGRSDTWEHSWKAAELSNGEFQVRIANVASDTSRDFSLDWIAVNIIYSLPASTPTVVPAELLFADVATGYWAQDFIERLYSAGITGGCAANPLRYCPEDTVSRAQMSVFLERGIHGSSYSPPTVGDSTGFSDVPLSYWSAAWIKQLASEGITGGCGADKYCPENPVTRAQMAVFLLRAKYGASYAPPGLRSGTGFGDVSASHWAAAWIKQLVAEGITAGCGSGNYCPEQPVTRAQMAVFLVRTFGLP